MKYSELYFDKILLLKVILFSSAIYQLLLMIVIILFAHWQIANRLLTCNPLLYIYLAQLFSEHFDKEVLNLKLRNVEFIENIKRENENKSKTKSNDDSKCSNLECNQSKQVINNLNKISTANNTIDEFDERTPSLKNKVHEHNHNCYHEHCLKNSNNNEDSRKININDQNNSHKCHPENTLKYSAIADGVRRSRSDMWSELAHQPIHEGGSALAGSKATLSSKTAPSTSQLSWARADSPMKTTTTASSHAVRSPAWRIGEKLLLIPVLWPNTCTFDVPRSRRWGASADLGRPS
jgi:hypothetical protein